MEIKNGIIIDGVLHEAVNYSNDSSCSICSLRKECDELENRCDEWICRLIDCRYFVNRGKVTDIKIELFNFYNFAGTPQEEAHREKLLNVLNK